MMLGSLQVGLAQTPEDFRAVQSLRSARFRGSDMLSDMDRFDPLCLHLLLRSAGTGCVIATARTRLLRGTAELQASYTAQFYDLSPLSAAMQPCLEIGRICIDRAHVQDPDTMRAILAGISRLALDSGAQMLLGCASFPGADAARHKSALAYLSARHIGPEGQGPARRAERDCVALAPQMVGDHAQGLRGVPKLLRLYLSLGGWVSDHAVLDHDLDTVHVFAAVEIARIPARRKRALQALARI